MSAGSSLPYRLRPNKAVDRELFLSLLKLPFENGERELVAYPQKRPLIRLTTRPPQLETPFSVFNESVLTPNDAFFVRYHLSDVPTAIDPAAFRLAIGGYGLFGHITSVTLRPQVTVADAAMVDRADALVSALGDLLAHDDTVKAGNLSRLGYMDYLTVDEVFTDNVSQNRKTALAKLLGMLSALYVLRRLRR